MKSKDDCFILGKCCDIVITSCKSIFFVSRSLEERQQKDNQSRITDIAKLEGKLDTENSARYLLIVIKQKSLILIIDSAISSSKYFLFAIDRK